MTLRIKFITFAAIIHLVLIIISVLLLALNKYFFVVAELCILGSVVITIRLYRSFLKPLDLLSAGIESIRARDFSATFIRTGQEELDRLIDVYNNMISQLRSDRLRQQEQHYFLERLLEATPIAVLILDLDDKVSMLNPAARAVLNVPAGEAIGRPLNQFTGLPGAELAGLQSGETRIIQVSGVETYKCRRSHFFDRGFPRHFILIEELTREILATQKRAYDKVIRMMSHEINNSIGAVNSILQSVSTYAPQLTKEDQADFTQAIRVAIDRNSGLDGFMTNFASVVRIPPPEKTRYDLHDVLRSVHVLMGGICAQRKITLVWELDNTPFMVNIDARQIEQVLVNIFKNAVEAIGQDGTITIRTDAHEQKTLRIIDNGPGIAPENRGNLFTPFFSTKKNGQGIGLTLAREILANHGFDFNLESRDDGFTEFRITFGQSPRRIP